MQNIVRIKIDGNQYTLRVGTAKKIIIKDFKSLEEAMEKFDFKTFYIEHLIIRWRGGEAYSIANSLTGEDTIFINSLNATLLFAVTNYHLSKR
jgi:hypothetical protein